MPPIPWNNLQTSLDEALNGATPQVRGAGLERFICDFFALVPGFSVYKRNVHNVLGSDEVDVVLWHDEDVTRLRVLGQLPLVEAKNIQGPVTSAQVGTFGTKMETRDCAMGLLICRNGITGEDMHHAQGALLIQQSRGRRILVITFAELQALQDTDQVVQLIKEKICELVATCGQTVHAPPAAAQGAP